MNAQDLFDELRHARTTLERLLAQAGPENADWRPSPRMRTLLELGNHLVQVPAVDLACSRGESEEAIRGLEGQLRRGSFDELLAVWDEGFAQLTAHFAAMPVEEFETRSTRAFYGAEATQKKWLLEMVTHAYHHRAQFFTYLKIMGRPVDMFTLY